MKKHWVTKILSFTLALSLVFGAAASVGAAAEEPEDMVISSEVADDSSTLTEESDESKPPEGVGEEPEGSGNEPEGSSGNDTEEETEEDPGAPSGSVNAANGAAGSPALPSPMALIVSGDIVTAFDALPAGVAFQTVNYGTPQSELNLPMLLAGTSVTPDYQTEDLEAEIPVESWDNGGYDPNVPGTYTFTPQISTAYDTTGVTPPVITVTVNAQSAPQNLDIARNITSKMTINNVEVTGGSSYKIENGDTVSLGYTWAIDPGVDTAAIMPGDYSYLGTIAGNIPMDAALDIMTKEVKTDDLILIGELSFELEDPGSLPSASNNWRIKQTYKEGIQGLLNVTGAYDITTFIDIETSYRPGDSIKIDLGGGIIVTLDVEDDTLLTSDLKKELDAYLDGSGTKIEANPIPTQTAEAFRWVITINEKKAPVNAAIVKDTLANIDKHRFAVSSGAFTSSGDFTVERWDGSGWVPLSAGDADGENGFYKLTSATTTAFELDLGEITSTYRITVISLVTNPASEGAHTYGNKATFNGFEKNASASRTVYYSFLKGGSAVLAGDGSYYAEWFLYLDRTGVFTETITVTDTFDTSLMNWTDAQLTAGELFSGGPAIFAASLITYNSGTNAEPGISSLPNGKTLANYITEIKRTDAGDGFTFKYAAEAGRGLRLTVRIPLTDKGLLTLRAGQIVRNDYSAQTSAGAKTAFKEISSAPSGNFTVTKATNGLDEKYLGWKMTVNIPSYTVTGLTIADEQAYPALTPANSAKSFVLDSETIALTLGGNPADWDVYFTLTDRNGKVAGDAGYDLSTGFKLVLKPGKELAPNQTLVITYKTRYELTYHNAALKTHNEAKFTNRFTAEMSFKEFADPATTSKTSLWAEHKLPAVNELTGVKTGTLATGNEPYLDAANGKKYVSWEVQFNLDGASLPAGIVVTDTFTTPGMTFKGTEANLVIKDSAGATLVNGVDYQITTAIVGSPSGFSVKFLKPVTKKIILAYDTYVAEPVKASYTNSAKITLADGKSITVDATVEMNPAPAAALNKGIKQDTANPNLYHWSVVINENKTTITNAVYTDVLSAGLLLDAASIEVWDYTNPGAPVPYTGRYTVGPNPIERDPTTGTTTFVVTFQDSLTETLLVTYSTTFDPDTAVVDPNNASKAILSNSAALTGDAVTIWTEVKTNKSFSSISASGEGKLFTVRVKKIDSETGNALDGAKFEIWALGGTKPLYENITTLNGVSYDLSLLAGTYILKEVETPGGYLTGSDQRFTVNKKTADSQNNGGDIVVVRSNEPLYTLRVIKQDQDGQALAGAVFDVRNSAGGSVGAITVNAQGVGSLGNLKTGTYTLIETTVPDGYVKPATNPTVALNHSTTNNAHTRTVYVENVKQPDSSSSTPDSSGPGSSSSSSTPPPTDPTPPDPTPTPVPPVVPPVVPPIVPPAGPVVPPAEDPPPAGPGEGPAGPVTPATPADPLDTPPAPAEDVPAPTALETALAAQSGNLISDLLNGLVPLGGMIGGVAWSLLNLMMSLIAIFNAILLFITMAKRRAKNRLVEDDPDDDAETNDEEQPVLRRRMARLKLPALLAGIIPGVLFLILENIRLPVTWITQWTPLIGAFFILHMALLIVQFALKKRAESEPQEEESPAAPHPSQA